jgi:hypothetical protein
MIVILQPTNHISTQWRSVSVKFDCVCLELVSGWSAGRETLEGRGRKSAGREVSNVHEVNEIHTSISASPSARLSICGTGVSDMTSGRGFWDG